MKRFLVIGIIMLCLLVSSPSGAEILDKARLSFVQENVLMQNEETGSDWESAPMNMPLISGDSLWVTEGGKAEVHFLGGVFLRADEGTRLTVLNLESGSGDYSIDVSLDGGRIYTHFTETSSGAPSMQIHTPALTAIISNQSRFNVDVYDDGYTEITVYKGAISVEGQFGKTRVHAGSRFAIGNNEVAELSPIPKSPNDSWVRWNRVRDSLYAESSESVRYLPAKLHDFSRDFDNYGRWVYLSDYGYAWTPTVVAAGWAPYKRGRWAWLRNDYVWVSYESWGWAPHHYGRWVFRIGIGWCWIPPVTKAVFWSPGFVAWIHAPTYVSWVPLAPRDIYFGYGYFGPYSVNIINVNINKIKVTKVYRNVRVKHAVTVVHKNTFLTGKRTKLVKAPRNPFLMKKKPISVGRPHLKPIKKTYKPLHRKLVKKRYRNEKHFIKKESNKRDYGAYSKGGHQESERPYTRKVTKRRSYDSKKYNAPRNGHSNSIYSIRAKKEQSGPRERSEIKQEASTRRPDRNYYKGIRKTVKRTYRDAHRFNDQRQGHSSGGHAVRAQRVQSGLKKRAEIKSNSAPRKPARKEYEVKREAGRAKQDFKKPESKKMRQEMASAKDFSRNGNTRNSGSSVKEHRSRFQVQRGGRR